MHCNSLPYCTGQVFSALQYVCCIGLSLNTLQYIVLHCTSKCRATQHAQLFKRMQCAAHCSEVVVLVGNAVRYSECTLFWCWWAHFPLLIVCWLLLLFYLLDNDQFAIHGLFI